MVLPLALAHRMLVVWYHVLLPVALAHRMLVVWYHVVPAGCHSNVFDEDAHDATTGGVVGGFKSRGQGSTYHTNTMPL